MCGIAGLISQYTDPLQIVRRMISPIAHRGPDDEGFWSDRETGVALGHRRLAIVDLSPAGHQPMTSNDERFILTFNGEIYNHLDIRRELEIAGRQAHWKGTSDTETLVEAVAAWGLSRTLQKSIGMFALALWDCQKRELTLARDRIGEKPLYYGWVERDFVFGSELKAITAHPSFSNRIDRSALRLFASRTHVPAPYSIYEQIFKLPPGCVLRLSLGAAAQSLSQPPNFGQSDGLRLERYWSYRELVKQGLAEQFTCFDDALDALEEALIRAVRGQSIADVPVGAFLSGGVDSSLLVALYQRISAQPVRTFSIGFDNPHFNEAHDARRVANYLGTVHHEHIVTVDEARSVIPCLATMYDEPFADSSQIPTFVVSRFARQQVTVALTGDGGDELFGGYNRYLAAPWLWQQMRRTPHWLRAILSATLGGLPPWLWSETAARLLGRHQPHLGSKMQKVIRVAGLARDLSDVHGAFLDEWSGEFNPVKGPAADRCDFPVDVGPNASDAVRLMYCDAVTYLPDDILCKVDRASMAVSLETRVPFLDHRVAAVASRIPITMKIRGREGKHILRQLLYRHAPRELVDRPKAGFVIPVGEWLKGPLRPWASELLNPTTLAKDGWFDPDLVGRRWADHLNGRRDSTQALWSVLMFQSWLNRGAEPKAPTP